MNPRIERLAAEMRRANAETFHRQAANRAAWKRRRKEVIHHGQAEKTGSPAAQKERQGVLKTTRPGTQNRVHETA